MRSTFLLLSALTLAASGLQAQSQEFQDGMWHIGTMTEVSNGSMHQTIPSESDQCLSSEQMLPMQETPLEGCNVTDIQTNGNTARWKIECANAKGSGVVHFSHLKVQGESTLQVTTDSGPLNVKTTISGHYTGPCQ